MIFLGQGAKYAAKGQQFAGKGRRWGAVAVIPPGKAGGYSILSGGGCYGLGV